ncbi:uncharacterized protein DSM5745_11138 [Aspergillus mulundensis]|uniref:Uncharacterized protein n=1 Tax=Aspergillus mulundensis TaxID=1810919 RepID=A0A3D8QAQ4_9EURO|nr:Uncharacterized protein DSM5745_11138 [Aspergillus mulundensis]RDW58932.1 Uncharacterized protein DSM5745_11138 [Aspergillus mulundensis]
MPPLTSSPAVSPDNTTEIGLEVVCSWPVSGQYGPGTRVLYVHTRPPSQSQRLTIRSRYYVLIAACVFARKEEWVRNACLAGALLFPAIAALHGIVLAAVHVDGAVDMDVYGAFQLCSIGILTAPLTARMSGTYFKDPRRHIIFLWTGLVLAGLLSITVELFRVKPSTCTHDDYGNPIPTDASQFPYDGATCDLRCSVEHGPFSPIRVGATNEIYVVPSPSKLTFGTATLLAAACCVPAIVSLLYFWSLVLQDTWNIRFGYGTDLDRRNEVIDDTNGATVGKMLQINGLVRAVLSTVEAPVFAAAVLAILILGEQNFFSRQVDWGTEPIASIGQWAPIVGTGFAIFGSLYLFLTDEDATPSSTCDCSCHDAQASGPSDQIDPPTSVAGTETTAPEMTAIASPDIAHTRPTRDETPDYGYRRGIGRALKRMADTISIAAHDRLHDDDFTQGPATDFPEIPAEAQRNSELQQIRDQYNQKRDSNGNHTLSRVGSTVSIASWRDGDRSSTTSHGISPRSSRPSTRSRSPSPLPSSVRGLNSSPASDLYNGSPSSSGPPIINPRKRQNTLEVPPHHGTIRRRSSISSVSSSNFTIPRNPASPTIVISMDDDDFPVFPPPGSPAPEREDPPAPSRHGRRFTS